MINILIKACSYKEVLPVNGVHLFTMSPDKILRRVEHNAANLLVLSLSNMNAVISVVPLSLLRVNSESLKDH